MSQRIQTRHEADPYVEDVFESVQRPWSWPGSSRVPGGVVMPMAAAAAYQTVEQDFSIDSVQTHFVSGIAPDPPLRFSVHRLSDGGRFAVRVVTATQAEKTVVQVTCSFVRVSAMRKGRSMKHCIGRATTQTIDKITLDDMSISKNDLGPWMKYQRFPLVYTGPGEPASSPPPETLTYTSVAQLSDPVNTDSNRLHALGIIALSDYHVLDCPPTVHGLRFAMPRIGDISQTPTPNDFQFLTSLNHSVQFHVQGGFRADELCYIEANTPWAGDRRAEINTRIFTKEGKLVATCKQEGYYALKEMIEGSKL